MNKFLEAVPAFLVALAGLALAWLWLWIGLVSALMLAFFFVALGFIVDAIGRKHLLPREPVRGTRAMEFWALCPGALAALGVASIIVANARYKPVDASLPQETKELISALLTAIAALLGAGLVKAAESADKNWMAPHVKHAFEQRFKQIGQSQDTDTNFVAVEPKSELACWVFYEVCHGVSGWEFQSRHQRARGIEKALREDLLPDT
jgi:hypothetical protein